MSETAEVEELLRENASRYVIFPIKKPEIWKMYKDAVSTFWTVEEVDLNSDRADWLKLNDDERFFIMNVLAFFAGSDGIVMENLATRFMSEVQIPEVRNFYAYQIFNEGIHGEMYSLLIDTYIEDPVEKDRLFNAIQNIPCIQKKADWAIKWIKNKDASFALRLLAFAVVEGIFFSGSFCSIYWLKKRGLLPGLTFSNELISRDEGLHTKFAVYLYSTLSHKLDEAVVHQLLREAVEIEKEFITESIRCNLIGMNAEMMSQYIEFVADRLLTQLGYPKIWNTANPFDFMELISLEGKSNFFERRVGEYIKADVGKNTSDTEFGIIEDF